MGLGVMKPDAWIEAGDDWAAAIAEKQRLYETRRADVFATLPDSEAAGQEVWERLRVYLPRYFPHLYVAEGEGLRLIPLGKIITAQDHHPLEAAGLVVAEDLALMRPESAHHKLVAGSISFPSRWRLRDKIGRPMAEIHDPVPGLNAKMGAAIEAFFARLHPDRPVERFNWSLVDDDAWLQEPRRFYDPTITATNAGQRMTLRIERQTLSRLPRTGDILFTIRIHQKPLGEIITPDRAMRLRQSLETMPPAMQDYKSFSHYAEAATNYLRSIR